jgi:hypothetical protein
MKATAMHIALAACLITLLAVAAVSLPVAQIPARAEADSYAARSCIPTNVGDRADDLTAYCQGWRAVRKDW